MKFLPLIWAGLWRKPVRTLLTLASIVVAFLLFGTLHGVIVGFDGALDKMSDVRLRVVSRANMLEPLPYAYRERIAEVRGVEAVSQFNIMLGYHQDPANGFAVPGIDIASSRDLFPEIKVPPAQVDAMLRTRDGALAGAVLLRERGWKVGDRIPVHTAVPRKDGAEVWTFEIVGVVNGEPGDDETFANEFWANYAYLDDMRATGNGLANQFVVKISDPAQAARIAGEIDALFANSPWETRTLNEKDYLADQVRQVGDVGMFVNAVLAAVLFTLLFLTGNTMMQSVRDRIPELGVLKAMGFGVHAIVGLVVAESLLLCLVAAALGLGLAALLFPYVFGGLGIPLTVSPVDVIGAGIAIAVVLGVLVSLLPARRAMRSSIVDALAGR